MVGTRTKTLREHPTSINTTGWYPIDSLDESVSRGGQAVEDTGPQNYLWTPFCLRKCTNVILRAGMSHVATGQSSLMPGFIISILQ